MFADYPHIVTPVYSFSIEVKAGDANSSIEDARISITVCEIFSLFFSTIQNVAIYVCDSLDSRQLARHRKFGLWFWRFNDGSLVKEDGVAIMEGVPIYNSILIHRNNSQLESLLEAFKDLNKAASQK